MASEKSPESTVGIVTSVTVEEAADLLYEAPDTIATLIRTRELPVCTEPPSAPRIPLPVLLAYKERRDAARAAALTKLTRLGEEIEQRRAAE